MFDLSRDDVPSHYWRALKSFRTAFSYGEPIAKHPGVGQKSVDWLIQHGLIEPVHNPQYQDSCYRVTTLGYDVLKRGSRSKVRERLPKLATLKPRVATLQPRVAVLTDD